MRRRPPFCEQLQCVVWLAPAAGAAVGLARIYLSCRLRIREPLAGAGPPLLSDGDPGLAGPPLVLGEPMMTTALILVESIGDVTRTD